MATVQMVSTADQHEGSVQLVQFGSFHHPDRFLETAELVAAAFRKRAVKLELFKEFGTGKHLMVDGWQMLAAMYHVSAGLESDGYVTFGDAFGFEATYMATHNPTGTLVSRGSAMCLNTEQNWGLQPRYEGKGPNRRQIGSEPKPLQQLRSMAQTRAQSKCLSNLLKYVARMAGFAPTPAEEMTGSESQLNGATEQTKEPQQRQQTAGGQQTAGPNLISERQRARLYAISRGANMPPVVLAEMVRGSGFTSSAEGSCDITRDKYDDLCNRVEAWKP